MSGLAPGWFSSQEIYLTSNCQVDSSYWQHVCVVQKSLSFTEDSVMVPLYQLTPTIPHRTAPFLWLLLYQTFFILFFCSQVQRDSVKSWSFSLFLKTERDSADPQLSVSEMSAFIRLHWTFVLTQLSLNTTITANFSLFYKIM